MPSPGSSPGTPPSGWRSRRSAAIWRISAGPGPRAGARGTTGSPIPRPPTPAELSSDSAAGAGFQVPLFRVQRRSLLLASVHAKRPADASQATLRAAQLPGGLSPARLFLDTATGPVTLL